MKNVAKQVGGNIYFKSFHCVLACVRKWLKIHENKLGKNCFLNSSKTFLEIFKNQFFTRQHMSIF